MIDKILILGWILLWSILIMENLVSGYAAYVFFDTWSKTWTLSVVSIGVWIMIWYWIKWFLSKDNKKDDDSYDF